MKKKLASAKVDSEHRGLLIERKGGGYAEVMKVVQEGR